MVLWHESKQSVRGRHKKGQGIKLKKQKLVLYIHTHIEENTHIHTEGKKV